jgi:spermidine/putrescine transport system permease protein
MRPPRAFDRLIQVPTALLTVTLILFAFALLLFLSLRRNDGGLIGLDLTLDGYVRAVTDPLYAMVLLRSLVVAGLVTAATVLAAYPMAYFIAFHAGARKGTWLLLVTLPFWTSYLLRVFAWKIILGYNGILNSALVGTGVVAQPLEALLYTPGAMVLTLAHAYAAFAILPIVVRLDTIDPRLIEAARDLGAAPAKVFRRVILPLSMPGVAAASIVVFIPTLGDYVTPALVGGPSSTMIGTVIQAQFGKANDWPFGAALSVLLMLCLGLGWFAIRAATRLARRVAA